MKLRPLASLLPFLLGAALVHAQDAAPAAAAPAPAAAAADGSAPAAPAKPKKTPLAKDMDKMNTALRKLRGQIKDATKNDSSLELLATIRDAASAAAQETPAFTSAQPEVDQAKFVTDYQAKMKDFLADVDAVVAAVKSGDNDTASKLFMKLGGDERAGHKIYRKPEEKKD